MQILQNETVNYTSAEEICKSQGYGKMADVTSASIAKPFLTKCIMENNVNETEQIWIRQVQGNVIMLVYNYQFKIYNLSKLKRNAYKDNQIYK